MNDYKSAEGNGRRSTGVTTTTDNDSDNSWNTDGYGNNRRVVKYWNRLPARLVLAPSVPIFKKKQLDRHWFKIFPAAPVSLLSPFIDNFLNTATTDYLCVPLTPNPRPVYVVIIGLRGHSYHLYINK